MLDISPADRMPREIAPGVFWIGDCLAQRHKGKVYHGYNAAYIVAGNQEGGVVAMIDLALVALRQAVADPEHAGRDLARHTLRYGRLQRAFGYRPVEHVQRSSSRLT